MSLDTLLDEDQRQRLEQQRGGSASPAQFAQQAGSGQLEDDESTTPAAQSPADGAQWRPDWQNGATDDPQADFPAPSGDETAQPPAPVAEAPPAAAQTPAQDLLKQVQGGQITHPAVDAAFGSPPAPKTEPNGSAKLAAAPGIDWKGLSDRLALARQHDQSSKLRDNVLTNLSSVLNPRARVDSGANETAGAEDDFKIAQAKAAEEKTGAKSQADAAELARRRELDQWKEMADRMKLTESAQKEGDLSKEKERTYRDKAAEEQAARSEREATGEANRKKMALETELLQKKLAAFGQPRPGAGVKAKAAEEKAKKGEENVATAADEIMNGQMTTDDLKGRDPEFRKAVTTELYKRDPKFSLHKAQLFNNQISEYYDAKPGSAGATLQATRTARDHLQLMKEQAAKLDNSDSRSLNTIKQKFANELGFNTTAEALGAFKTGQITTGSELASAYNHATEGGHKAYEMILDPTTPPKVAAAQFDMITKQMDERMSEREAPLRALAQSPGHHKMIDELFPKASASGTAKEGDESKLSSGVPIVYRNGKWVKK